MFSIKEQALLYKVSEEEFEDYLIEKSKEILQSRIVVKGFQAKNPQVVEDYLKLKIGSLEHEVFVCLFFDVRNRLIECNEMFRGTLDQSSVYPREVAKQALKLNASSVILAHNHPSGDVSVSDTDRAITKTLKEALGLFDIRVLDHIIVSSINSYSFAHNGLI